MRSTIITVTEERSFQKQLFFKLQIPSVSSTYTGPHAFQDRYLWSDFIRLFFETKFCHSWSVFWITTLFDSGFNSGEGEGRY